MLNFGKLWRHVMINTRCTWLPGDERGFRNRKHRIHSSGDYKNPPPPKEHEGLREYNLARAGEPRSIPPELRELLGRAFLARLGKEGFTVLAIAVSALHVHALVNCQITAPPSARSSGAASARPAKP